MIKDFVKTVLHCMPDGLYLRLKYRLKFKKRLNLSRPVLFNEKLQWLKLHDRKEEYTMMVDKYEVKKYVSRKIGEEYVIPTIGVYDKFEEINFEELPQRFVIKCTHDSGGLVIVDDKDKLDMNYVKKRIKKCLDRNYYYQGREWPYKNIKPRIIIEKNMKKKNDSSIRDYKFFCFNGAPKLLYISDDSHTNHQKIAFFDMRYRQLPIKRFDYDNYDTLPMKPKNFEKMKEYSRLLSEGIPHVRVDWYEIGGRLYFGEFTFTTGGGMIPFASEKWNKKLGDLIDLDLVKK